MKNIWFIVIFTGLGFFALQVPVTQLAGSKATFTLFDFFGPIATGFIGVLPGLAAIFLMQFINFLVHGANVVDLGTIIRFFPMLFAALYFGMKSRAILLVPLVAIAAFNLHPIGRTVWYYSLFWVIPILCHFARDRSLFFKSLGTTFTAHAVGGALWIHVFELPQAVWISLIPVVLVERLLFTAGIAGMYVVLNNALNFLIERKLVTLKFMIDRKYLAAKKRAV